MTANSGSSGMRGVFHRGPLERGDRHDGRVSGPPGAVAAVRVAVRRALDDLPSGALVLVACSGGPDSLALAAGAAFVAGSADAPGWRAGAVVVDHALQGGSDEVAARAAAACRDLGLDPVLVRRVAVSGPGGPEAAARDARYAALETAAREVGAAAVLLGHTLDDQAETVLLGLARGSGPRSLAGMPAVRGALRRPLLGLTRAQTVAACAAAGLRPWHDPTNSAGPDAPLRSRVRDELVPVLDDVLGPGVVAALARTADLAREQADAIDALAAELLVRAASSSSGNASGPAASRGATSPTAASSGAGAASGWDVATLAAAPDGLRRAALRAAAVGAGAAAGALTRVHVLALDSLCTDWHGQGPVQLPGGPIGGRRYGRLFLHRGTDGRELGVDDADMGTDLERVLLSEGQIHARLDELAAQIDADHAGSDLLLVGVLKGAVMVMADLARRLHTPVQMDWMAVSSYGSGTKSSGVVRILKDLDADLTGRHVLIVEDIIDSGLTLSWLLSNLRSRGPASVEVAALLRKPEASKVEVDVRYVGFEIPNEFVVGYGLDFAEKYRNLPFVGTLAPHVYAQP